MGVDEVHGLGVALERTLDVSEHGGLASSVAAQQNPTHRAVLVVQAVTDQERLHVVLPPERGQGVDFFHFALQALDGVPQVCGEVVSRVFVIGLHDFVLCKRPQHVGLRRHGFGGHLEVADAVVMEVHTHTKAEGSVLGADAADGVKQLMAERVRYGDTFTIGQHTNHEPILEHVAGGQGGHGHGLWGLVGRHDFHGVLGGDWNHSTKLQGRGDLALELAALAAIRVALLDLVAGAWASFPRIKPCSPVHVGVASGLTLSAPSLGQFFAVNAVCEHTDEHAPRVVVEVTLGGAHVPHL